MHTISKEELRELQGLGGLERLCRVYGSAEYLEKKLRDWSDDVFFLELWDELQDRARRNIGGKNLAGEMSVEDVAERTSSSVGSEEDTGALFDETASAYKRLRVRTEGYIEDQLIDNIKASLKPYSRINPWSLLLSPTEPSISKTTSSSLALTAELDSTVDQLTSCLSFLSNTLAQAPLRRIARQLALALQTFMWDQVLMRNSFSSSGSAQYVRDISAIWEVMDRYLGEGQGELGMRKLGEAMVLLRLGVKNEGESLSEEGREGGVEGGKLGLWEVDERVYRSNESGREVLEELGLEILSESDARAVLERRVEKRARG